MFQLPTDESAPDRESMKPDEANMIQVFKYNKYTFNTMINLYQLCKHYKSALSYLENNSYTLVLVVCAQVTF